MRMSVLKNSYQRITQKNDAYLSRGGAVSDVNKRFSLNAATSRVKKQMSDGRSYSYDGSFESDSEEEEEKNDSQDF